MHSGKLRVDPDWGRTRPPKRAKHFHPVNSPVICSSPSGTEGTQPTEQRESNLEPSSMPSAGKVEYKITDHPLIELIDTDSLEGDTSTEQGKTINSHEASQKHEADMLHTSIQDSTRNSQFQSDVPANTWGTLLSKLHVMATAIKHQADKQDIQVDLLNIMAKYIVGIDSKLQALNDLIQRAQKQNYIQQVACDFAISGDNPQTIVPILNDILAEVEHRP
ncbi:hypothetical protein NDU88_002576 [Pleurodeles waltl]|uniref:Phosphoprotein n=1 Tax=Pleurodeles waltl TaxID=8319 RepID=A0AAV7VEX6_PLEWA|nr:hypothetical protein NDU88_002576 [Pleurodeles waltl]